ncbi:MAG: HAMP domain-containing histidine kinase [Gemmatimonadota bacterium]|nr:MAG: HAMP domain-containing histidine kinase [Gemmatimonadota bacterium]
MEFLAHRSRFRFSGRIHELSAFFKGFLFIAAILLILAFLIYNQYVVHRLRNDERRLLHVYANLYAAATSELSDGAELNLIFDEVIRPTDFPIIATTADGTPYAWKGIGIDTDDSKEKALSKARRMLAKMDSKTEPIPLSVQETGQVVGYLHYGDSGLVRQLSWMPYIQIVVVGLFIFIGFLGYRNIKKSEQRFIWVGMAKETAHQLGTPLSSLMGWLELMRVEGRKEGRDKILQEIENDLKRLSKIVSRFSQIGSEPKLEKQPIIPILTETAGYFRQRLPQLSKRIEIEEHYKEIPPLSVNRELLGWVFENLFKNSIDSIGKDGGRIEITTDLNHDKEDVIITFTDTGRGIDSKVQRRIFAAGYSTKKRGWGLGLTLAKRIIEEYHGGRILLKESTPEQGTIFHLTLPIGSE